ncbi:hypothetical protein [Dinghuibacter silviterrae]|uniref:Uncharacterized protein n=1 Tax=Dinghuibacter silviterrae TaxID=1539049 RepID=A0A4R8DU44_9BACT|nr:hypothetical protein [Dinghuibacter silviterrae]TDX01872.1 hypothetical protein EDB95_2916 [Dinghuibacter silviterrae]
MKLHVLLALALVPLLSARPALKKAVPAAPFWSVTINNNTGDYWINYEVRFYDAATGTTYGEESFRVAAGDSYTTAPYEISGAQPTIYISWSTAPTPAQMHYSAINPNGQYIPNGITCHSINKVEAGSMVFNASPDANGSGYWTVNFYSGATCP